VARYVAFLRGMNVGGHRITNAELAKAVALEGMSEIATFRASGNVIFSSASRSPRKLESLIEEGLQGTLGYAVPAYVRSGSKLRSIAATEPFTSKQQEALQGKRQVALLRAAPSPAAKKRTLALAGKDDALAIEGSEMHWLPTGRMSDSELDFKAIEALLGAITVRTAGTVAEIAARYFADG
jgi:uncharacterized protein (DUF1697 family)